MRAWRIVGWRERYEVTENGGPYKGDAPKNGGKGEPALRKSPLAYVRNRVHGLRKGDGWDKLQAMAGPRGYLICVGLFDILSQIAADQEAPYRGWVLTGDLEAIDEALLAQRMRLEEGQVRFGMAVLIRIGWIEMAECSFARKPLLALALDPDWLPPRSLPEKTGEIGTPSESESEGKVIEKINIKAEAPVPEERAHSPAPTGSPGPAPAEPRPITRAESREPNAEPKAESREVEAEPRTGGRAGRGAKGPDCGADARDGEELHSTPKTPRPSSPTIIVFDAAAIDPQGDEAGLIVEGVSSDPRLAREQVLDRALQWARRLMPAMEAPRAASRLAAEEAFKNTRCAENRFLWAWDQAAGAAEAAAGDKEKIIQAGGRMVVKLLAEMQTICRRLAKRPTRGQMEDNAWKIWVTNVAKVYGVRDPSKQATIRAP